MKTLSMPAKTKSLAYLELTKPRITWMILVSTALGFFLGSKPSFDIGMLFWTLFGSGLVSAGAGALNHFAEEDSDRLMERTRFRPIHTGIICSEDVMYFGIALILLGTILLYFFVNIIVTTLALVTALLYLFIYTPLKKITWLNTTIGAIPGALPPVGGWAALSQAKSPSSSGFFFCGFGARACARFAKYSRFLRANSSQISSIQFFFGFEGTALTHKHTKRCWILQNLYFLKGG